MGSFFDMQYFVVVVTPSNPRFIKLYDDSRDRDQVMDSRESDKSFDDRRARDSFSRDNTTKRRRTVGFER